MESTTTPNLVNSMNTTTFICSTCVELGQGNLVQSGLISDETNTNLFLVWPCIRLFVVAPGIWANVINMRTFLRMGLGDSVTIGFFVLAISDFFTLITGAIDIPLNVLTYLDIKTIFFFYVQPELLSMTLTSFGNIFTRLASLITTFLAIQRCLCIVKPLQFRDMFSTRLMWLIMVLFTCLSSIGPAIYVAVWKAKLVVDPFTNRSRYILSIRPILFEYVRKYQGLINYLILPVLLEVIILGCLLLMGKELKASARFRKDAASSYVSDATKTSNKDKDKSVEIKTRSKERTAITQVVLICVIFITANIPRIGSIMALFIVPGFDFGGSLNNLRFAVDNARVTADLVNAAINLLVYYKYNTKFRKLCFGVKKKTGM